MLLRLLPVLLAICFTPLVVAQHSGEEEEEAVRQKRAALQESGDLKAEEGKETPDEAWENMTPEQRLNANLRHGASNFLTFVAAAKPARLMPGQSGVVVITAVLRGNAVLPAPAQLELTSATAQGLITLAGQPVFRPAEPGRLASAYRGKLVYDNYAICEVPVVMSAQARLGQKQLLSFEFKFDLYDGNTAQVIGRFVDRVSTEIEVGQAADPGVLPAAQRQARALAQAAALAADGAADAAQAVRDNQPAPVVVAAADAARVVEGPSQSPAVPSLAPAEALPTEEDGAIGLPLLVAGLAVLLLLGLLLTKKR